jgi:hypothetical protein
MLTCTAGGKILKPCVIEASKSRAACNDAGSTRYDAERGISCWKQENNTVKQQCLFLYLIQPQIRNRCFYFHWQDLF